MGGSFMTALKGERSKKGLKGFIYNNLYVILALFVPMAIMGLNFIIRRFYPFGGKMILVVDSWHQYYPFLSEYQRMLKEGVSVFYSWNTGGGANFLGVIANYLGSPLYLLSYFIPSGTPWLQVFLAFTVVLRIGLAGMFFAIFLRKVFRKNDISLLTFSLMYAFCAFLMGYYWNMMWLDTVALLPLVIAGVVDVLRDKKFTLYIISLALAVLCNFYMGYMVCLFVLIFSICYTVVSFRGMRESLKNAGRMLLYSLIAFMITAVLTFPAFMALQNSDSAGVLSTFPLEYTVNKGFGYKDKNPVIYTFVSILETITNLLIYNHPLKMDTGAPNIACSVLALVLLVIYFFTKKISRKERIVSGALCMFMVLSFVVNQLNYIWHGMATPAMVYYRFSYIFSFVIIVLAYRAYTFIDELDKKRFLFVCAVLSLYLLTAFFLHKPISVYFTLGFALLLIAIGVVYRLGKINKNVFSLLLCIVMIAESFLTAYIGVATVGDTTISNYPKNRAEVQKLKTDYLPEDELYRTEFTSTYSLNDGDLYDLYGITTFNSMVNGTYSDFMMEFGLAASKVNNRYAYFENTPVCNLFLNIRYLFSIDEDEKSLSKEFMDNIGEMGECTLYENNAYVPMGFMTSEKLLENKLHKNWVSPFDVQNSFFTTATGIDKEPLVYVPINVGISGEGAEMLTKKQGYDDYYSVPFAGVGKVGEVRTFTVDYVIEEDGLYYGLFKNSRTKDSTLIVNGDKENAVTYDQSYTGVYTFGNFKAGDKVSVSIPTPCREDSSIVSYLYRLDEEVIRQGVEKLSQSTLELTSKSQTKLEGRINVKEAGLFYTSILYDKGFKAFVDGKEVEITPVAETFLAFPLSEGEHEIKIVYVPQGFYPGLAVSCAGVLILTVLCILRRKNGKRAKAERAVPASDTE